MNKKTKVLILQFVCYSILFLGSSFAFHLLEVNMYIRLIGSAIIASLFSPQFKVVHTSEGEKAYWRFVFNKKIRELKW